MGVSCHTTDWSSSKRAQKFLASEFGIGMGKQWAAANVGLKASTKQASMNGCGGGG